MGAVIPRTTRAGGSEIIPADVRAVTGVVSTDTNVGVFPAYSAGSTTVPLSRSTAVCANNLPLTEAPVRSVIEV